MPSNSFHCRNHFDIWSLLPRRKVLHVMSPRRTPRTKTFTGCWTCRSRRVKCDQQTPNCLRCRRFGVPCGGYGVRLSWLVNEGEDPVTHLSTLDDLKTGAARPLPSRRTFEHQKAWPTPALSSMEIDAMLERIDDCPTTCGTTEKGVFSVFPAHRTIQDPDQVAPKVSEPDSADLPQVHATGLSFDQDFNRPQDPECGDQEPESIRTHSSNLEDQLFHVPCSTDPAPDTFGDAGLPVTSSAFPNDRHNIAAAENPPNAQSATDLYTTRTGSHNHHVLQPPPPRHLDVLQMPASQKKLIHHWVMFTSRKLVLLDEPHNPSKHISIPSSPFLSCFGVATLPVSGPMKLGAGRKCSRKCAKLIL